MEHNIWFSMFKLLGHSLPITNVQLATMEKTYISKPSLANYFKGVRVGGGGGEPL